MNNISNNNNRKTIDGDATVITHKSAPAADSNINWYKTDPLQKEYFESLSIKEKKACIIAKEHLETSFQLEKSVGYLSWLKNKK